MADLRSYLQGIDLDTGAGTDYILGVNLRLSASGGSTEALGQKAMAGSIPVVLASDQTSFAVDTELPAAAALTDNFANPTAPAVGAFAMLWDGATWDRAPGSAADGALVNLGTNNDVTVTGTVTVDSELPGTAALADNTANPTTTSVGTFPHWFDGSTWDRALGNATDGLLVNLGANNDITVTGTVTVDSELPTASALADDTANPTLPSVGSFLMGFDGTNWDRVRVANTGRLQVDVITGGGSDIPTNPVVSYQTSASVAAGSSGALTTAEAASKKLAAVEVWASVPYRATLHTVDNAVESSIKGIGGGQAHQPWRWDAPHRDYVTLGATAGLDAFRANVTNLDDANAADCHAVFFYQD